MVQSALSNFQKFSQICLDLLGFGNPDHNDSEDIPCQTLRKSALTSLQTPASIYAVPKEYYLGTLTHILPNLLTILASMYKPLLLASPNLLASATDYKHFDCGTDSPAATKDFLHAVQSLHSNTSHGSLVTPAPSPSPPSSTS